MQADVQNLACWFPRMNAKAILAISIVIVAVLAGFCTGLLYALTLVPPEDGLDLAHLATEADYIVLADVAGMVFAVNGLTGEMVYNSTSASSVINRAIQDLPSIGGSVFVKAGTYEISETIKIPSNVTLTGAGSSSRLVLAAGTNTYVIENADTSEGNSNILIANLHLDGNEAKNPHGRSVIHFLRVWNSTIQDCSIHDSAFAGILAEYGGRNIIRNNHVSNNRNAGIEGTHEDHDIVANNIAYSNRGDPYGHGIDYCTGSRNNIFDGNICYNNGLTSGGGLALWDGCQNIIIGNILASNYVGLTVGVPSFGEKTHGNMIMGNTVSNNTHSGLHIEGEHSLVSKNTFSFNLGDGVYINGSDTRDIIIEGNRLEENQGWQVHVTTFPADTIIRNNFISGDSLVEDQGTNTAIKWNSGYSTESSGIAVVPTGHANVTLEHGLVSTPTHANITPRDNLEGRSYWYTANSTHITVHISIYDASNDYIFDWSAET